MAKRTDGRDELREHMQGLIDRLQARLDEEAERRERRRQRLSRLTFGLLPRH